MKIGLSLNFFSECMENPRLRPEGEIVKNFLSLLSSHNIQEKILNIHVNGLLLVFFQLFGGSRPKSKEYSLPEEVIKKILYLGLIKGKEEINFVKKTKKLIGNLCAVSSPFFFLFILRGKEKKREEITESILKNKRERRGEILSPSPVAYKDFLKKTGLIFCLLQGVESLVNANDEITFGEVFPIIEKDLREVIQEKLRALQEKGELEKHQKEIQKRIETSIKRPLPVEGISHTVKPRIYTFDPSVTVPYDLKDHQGRIFHKAGTRINPLQSISLTKPLLFIDGDEGSHVQWALSQYKENPLTKIILVKGAPLDLSQTHDLPFYFDQGGKICEKLNIQHVPALVRQKGDILEIEELKID